MGRAEASVTSITREVFSSMMARITLMPYMSTVTYMIMTMPKAVKNTVRVFPLPVAFSDSRSTGLKVVSMSLWFRPLLRRKLLRTVWVTALFTSSMVLKLEMSRVTKEILRAARASSVAKITPASCFCFTFSVSVARRDCEVSVITSTA